MIPVPPPPPLSSLAAGTLLVAGLSHSTVLPDIDFETYSPAGHVFHVERAKWEKLPGMNDKGLFAVGAAVYAMHPDAEVLSCAYDLKDGKGRRLWTPGMHPPYDITDHIADGGIIEAWNAAFEFWVWNHICVRRYGWPKLRMNQMRCAMAKSRAFGLPGSLEKAADVLNIQNKKDKRGKQLLDIFSVPHTPTLKDPRMRILTYQEPGAALELYEYNLRDIEAEAEISSLVPDLSADELEFWQCDQAINRRGVQVDLVAVRDFLKILGQMQDKYNQRLSILTDGQVAAPTEVKRIREWLESKGTLTETLSKPDVARLLEDPALPITTRQVLEVRQLMGSAAVKKLNKMFHQTTAHGRIHDLFIYHSARTGRAAGAEVQPQNMPKAGPTVSACIACAGHHGAGLVGCPWCGNTDLQKSVKWSPASVTDAIETASAGDLTCMEYFWGDDVLSVVSGCLRGMFVSAPGHDLVCSDYSSIEAVVLAFLAGEEWRMDVFRTHGKIYEMSASKLSGVPFDEIMQVKEVSGEDHPLRALGKTAELSSGYASWIGGWKAFGADKFYSDTEIQKCILAWRAASPAIVEFWGGQQRNWKPELFGLEGAAVSAVIDPGVLYSYRQISYIVKRDVLYCTLPSGRHIVYHRPRLAPSSRRAGTLELTYETWNSNTKYGPPGWIRLGMYGGKLTENVVQGTARDILAHAIVRLEKSGYPVVLHVHDEIVSEIPENRGSIQEFEEIMSTMPQWASGWPIKAKGGWRAKRYAK